MGDTQASRAACHRVGVVVIGRNEGERMTRCLTSVLAATRGPLVYVDSGSTDDSAQTARALGADVVQLATAPFTAARGRNAGTDRIVALHPALEFIQFLDGDTVMQADWIARAVHEFDSDRGLAAVTGRRREIAPHRSVYNRMCDVEWNTEVGDTASFGGDVMVRVADLRAVGGYREALIAGEDPELALRLRARGRRIVRVEAEMTLHDAGMTRFSQWWRRSVRAGHAFAQCADEHRDIGFWRHEVNSNWAWGAAVPALAAMTALPSLGGSVLLAAGAYALLANRVRRNTERSGTPPEHALTYGLLTVLGKVPGALGQTRYALSKRRGRPTSLIEYK